MKIFMISIWTATLLLTAQTASAVDMPVKSGVVVKKSANDVSRTVHTLERVLSHKKITPLVVNHAQAAAKVGIRLRPTVLLIFGNPVLGSTLMQLNQAVGLDLPLKVLVWEDDNGQTWIAYNDPHYIATRYGIPANTTVIKKMAAILGEITDKAAAP